MPSERAKPTKSAFRSAHLPPRFLVSSMVWMSPSPHPLTFGSRNVLSTIHS